MASVILRCSLGDLPVSTGLLRLPPRGGWSASVELGADGAPELGAAASLVFVREDGSEDVFAGIVRRSQLNEGSQTLTVSLAAGAGKLLADVPPRDHVAGAQPVPAGLVARSICDDAGELLADGVEADLDGYQLGHWTRLSMPARDALDLLADVLGLAWRVQADGTIFVGPETWPEPGGDALFIGWLDDDLVIYAPDGAPLRPGMAVDGVQALGVEYQISASSLRAQVRYGVAGDPPRVPDLMLYRASYAATVKAQRDDGTLDLEADDPRLGTVLLGVPFRVGIPGAKVTIPSGSRVRVGFEGADPRGIFAASLDQDRSATRPVARKGDTGAGGTLAAVGAAPGAPIQFTYTPPGGDPQVGSLVTITMEIRTGSEEISIR
jgi:hypothetical protein